MKFGEVKNSFSLLSSNIAALKTSLANKQQLIHMSGVKQANQADEIASLNETIHQLRQKEQQWKSKLDTEISTSAILVQDLRSQLASKQTSDSLSMRDYDLERAKESVRQLRDDVEYWRKKSQTTEEAREAEVLARKQAEVE